MSEWNPIAEKKLKAILRKVSGSPTLKRLVRSGTHSWKVELRMVNGPAMARLNRSWRGKDYATDVLSFPAPEIFRRQGVLGELVICIPVMRKQARELKHSPEEELQVLLVHGVLHLLGFDHELGEKEADQMARWEKKLLGSKSGLIRRAHHSS